MRCERDYDDEGGCFAVGGCEAGATETVEVFGGDAYRLCALCAAEARRLSGVVLGIASGDPEARRLSDWINASADRAEHDRRVATLPTGGV